MNELALDVLMRLARTTLLLSVAVAALYIVLRIGRLHSPNWRRWLAAVALLQGVIWVQAPLTVPWYELVPAAAESVEPPATEPLPMVSGGVGIALPISAIPPGPILVDETAPETVPPPREEPAAAIQLSWQLVLCTIWAVGILAIVGASLLRYVAFVRRLPPARQIEPRWRDEFEDVRSAMKTAGQLRFQVTDALGPLLCWTPRGSLLLVPDGLWRELTGVQRRAVLRHELAHFQRHDLIKSLLVRVLALPHWFNPLAWWAVRLFEEAGEWICDEIAAGKSSTEYAGALVRLCEPPLPVIWPTTAARGSGVAHRVRRLLDTQTKEDSIMKKLILAAVAIALLVAGIVRVELVAQPRPEADAKTGNIAARNAERAAKQQAMIDAARRTYEVLQEIFNLGTGSHNEVYVWSSYLRSSQVRAAESRQQVTKACAEHLDRMRKLNNKIAALGREGSRGGEADKLHATEFYVAEAELLLLEAQNNEQTR